MFITNDQVATASDDRSIIIWNVKPDGMAIKTIKAHTNKIYSLAVSPNATKLTSGGYDNEIIVYDVASFDVKCRAKCSGPVRSLCYYDSSTILAGIDNSEMIAIDDRTGYTKMIYEGVYTWPSITIKGRHSRDIVSYVFYKDENVSRHLACYSRDMEYLYLPPS